MRRWSVQGNVFVLLFVAIALCIVVSSWMIYKKSVVDKMDGKLRDQSIILQQYQKNIDLVYEQIYNNAKKFGLDSLFDKYDNGGTLAQADKVDVITNLKLMKQTNRYIRNVYYVRNVKENNREYIDADLEYANMPFHGDWQPLFGQTDASLESARAENIRLPDGGDKVVATIVLRLPFNSAYKTSMLLLQVDVGALIGDIVGDMDGQHIVVAGRKGDVLPVGAPPPELDLAWSEHTPVGASGFDYLHADGTEMIRMHALVNSLDLYLIKLDRKSRMLAAELALRNSIAIVGFVLLLFGACFSYVLSVITLAPIRRMFAAIQEMLPKGEPAAANMKMTEEIRYINRNIGQLLHENSDLKQAYRKMLPQMKDRFYYNLLMGHYLSEEEIERQAAFLQLDVGRRRYGVIVLELDAAAGDQTGRYDETRVSLLGFFEEALSGQRRPVVVEIGNDCWTLLLEVAPDADEREFNRQAFAICESIQRQMESGFALSVSCGIGLCGGGPQELHAVFKQVRGLLTYRINLGDGIIVNRQEQSCEEPVDREPTILEDTGKLANILQTRNVADAELFVAQYVRQLFDGHQPTYRQEKLIDLLQVALKAADAMAIGRGELFGDSRNGYAELLQLQEPAVIAAWFGRIVRDIVDGSNNRMRQEENQLTQSVCAYVERHYGNPNLTIRVVSEAFNLNPIYLGRIFKNGKGLFVMEYVNLVRIEKAKDLLGLSDTKIYDISAAVGFQTTHYFIKLFKEKYGVTPGQYRKYVLSVSEEA
ncbi:MAG: helix-turn-helix domain-containing protein [Paenibacillaceae bacterium]|nr:helix-turn-helix domain-containing protein [Paenibacillaceae bacterium]